MLKEIFLYGFTTLSARRANISFVDTNGSGTEHNSEQDFFTDNSSSGSPLFGSQIVEGLHVTGTPIEVDIERYRLNVTGLVEKELSLTYENIKSMSASRVHVVLECPGYFVDEGYWTGIK